MVATSDFAEVIAAPEELFDILKILREMKISTKLEIGIHEGRLCSVVLPRLEASHFLRMAKQVVTTPSPVYAGGNGGQRD